MPLAKQNRTGRPQAGIRGCAVDRLWRWHLAYPFQHGPRATPHLPSLDCGWAMFAKNASAALAIFLFDRHANIGHCSRSVSRMLRSYVAERIRDGGVRRIERVCTDVTTLRRSRIPHLTCRLYRGQSGGSLTDPPFWLPSRQKGALQFCSKRFNSSIRPKAFTLPC